MVIFGDFRKPPNSRMVSCSVMSCEFMSVIMCFMTDDLQEHINALERSSSYHVERVIKQAPQEITEEVFFEGKNGAKLGPFVRKRIDRESDLGRAYEVLYEAERQKRRFLYLPQIRECYRTEEELVVVMDWVAGETLVEVLQHEEPSLTLAAPLFVRLCEAVTELHTSFNPPIIHRDITPSNIVVSGGTPTLIDLGIARRFNEEAALDTHQFGTFGFASPEQFGFGQSDVRTDVYALGMVLYYCCTGTTPDAKARSQGFKAPEIPLEISAIIEKATALSPDDRYGSVEALRLAFESAVRELAKTSTEKPVALPDQPNQYPPPKPIGDQRRTTPFSGSTAAPVSMPIFSSPGHSDPTVAVEVDKSTPTSPLPFVPAVVWDTILLFVWLVFVGLLTFVGEFKDPVTGIETPAIQKPFMLLITIIVLTVPVSLLFSSRPLQEINRKWCWSWKTRLIILGFELIGFIVLLVLISLFGQ